jgi:hypothetical protein
VTKDAKDEQRTAYIVMEYILGDTPISPWNGLDDTTNSNIVESLRKAVDAVRQIPEQGFYGRLGKHGYYDDIFWGPDAEALAAVQGPFADMSGFIGGVVQRFLNEGITPQRADWMRRVLPTVLRNQRPVFTHTDLQRKNIIIGPDNMPVILDWESAGWEYLRTMVSFGQFNDDWYLWVAKLLNEYILEFGWLNRMIRDLWS